jgi:hypothetical protein
MLSCKEEDIKEFIKRLPPINQESVHLIMLAVRSRKALKFLGFKIKDLVVERKVLRAGLNKENTVNEWGWWRSKYFDTVYNYAQLQLNGRYHVREMLAPYQSMAIYGTLAPRNVRSAALGLIKDDVDLLGLNDIAQLAKQSSLWFGKLHATRVKGVHFQTIDLDTMDHLVYTRIRDLVSSFDIWMTTQTARGYHIILDLSKSEHAREFYAPGKNNSPSYAKSIIDTYGPLGVEMQKDSQEPIPGTLYFKDESLEPNYIEILQ